MGLTILQGVARDVALQVNAVATGLPNTTTAMNAMLVTRAPGAADNDYYYRADSAVWQAGLPTFGATQWLAGTHEADGRWRFTVPIAATSGRSLGDSIEMWCSDNATPASRTTYSETVDLQVVAAFGASVGGGTVSHTLQLRNGTLVGDPPPGGAVFVDVFAQSGYSSSSVALFSGSSDGNGNLALNVAAGNYTARPMVMAGWAPTAATTNFTAVAAGTTVIAGSSTAIATPSAGATTVRFGCYSPGATWSVAAGTSVKVFLEPGGRYPKTGAQSSADTLATLRASGTTGANGILDLELPRGCRFTVDCSDLGEYRDFVYTLDPDDATVNFATLRQEEKA